MTTEAIAPLSVGQIFLQSFSLLKKTWIHLFPIIVFLLVAVFSPSLLFYNPKNPFLFFWYYIFSIFVFSSILYYMLLFERGERISLPTSLLVTLRKLWLILLVTLLVMFLTVIGYLFLIIPGIIVTVWLSMCIPLVLVLDHEKPWYKVPWDIVVKSYELTTDNWGRTALVIFIPSILVSICGFFFREVFWINLIGLAYYRIFRDTVFFILSLGYFPWVAALVVLQFEDLKKRQAIRAIAGR